jgi:hypothetical protein
VLLHVLVVDIFYDLIHGILSDLSLFEPAAPSFS